MVENIKAGNKYRGLINNCLIEVVKIEKGYVTYRDLNTCKDGQLHIDTFKRLQLEEVKK